MKKKSSEKLNNFDFQFFAIVMSLLIFGLIMVFSASSASAHHFQKNALYFIERQGIYAVIGIIGMLYISKVDYKKIQAMTPMLLTISLVLVILVLIPGIGKVINGARRWLGVGSLTIQPSEIVKYTLPLFLAHCLSLRKEPISTVKEFIPFLALVGVFAGLILLEPHMSGAIVVAFVGMIVLIIGGTKLIYFVVPFMAALPIGIALIVSSPYRLKRITTFMNPEADMLGDGYQIVQSLYAIGSGGFFGLGLGQSRQKFLYIPEPHNDFIFSIICEELGFIGAIFVILLFALLIKRGLYIAINAPDKFSCLAVSGIILLIAFQVIINILVVTSSIPVTGMPLPFFSYGGSALVFTLLGMGFILNVSRNLKDSKSGKSI